MTTPIVEGKGMGVVYAIEDASIQHNNAVREAKKAWFIATHPTKRPTPAQVEEANERFRVAYNASLRVYMLAILAIDKREP